MIKTKSLGQYFTISEELQTFVFNHVKYKSSLLLEPSVGAGHLIKKFKEYDNNYPMICYEIDNTVKPIIEYNKYQQYILGDFTQQPINQTFKTIIGNPPYVKQKTGNLYLKFIELCYNYLDEHGEMIFIVPSDFIKLTSASHIISNMVEHGSFTHFLFPNNEKLFDYANIDVLVFRYEKGLHTNKTIVNGESQYCNVRNGIITFSKTEITGVQLSDLFDVYVGIVSGKDEVYRVPFGNIDVLNSKEELDKFIFIDKFPCEHADINNHLFEHKEELLARKIKKFSDENWFEWGAPRNIGHIKSNWGNPCIYVKNLTRNKDVAFVGTVQYFGGTLLCIIPKKTMNLTPIVDYINSDEFKKDYMYSGRFKIGHKQLASSILQL